MTNKTIPVLRDFRNLGALADDIWMFADGVDMLKEFVTDIDRDGGKDIKAIYGHFLTLRSMDKSIGRLEDCALKHMRTRLKMFHRSKYAGLYYLFRAMYIAHHESVQRGCKLLIGQSGKEMESMRKEEVR